jgi:hypothetical protein
MCATLPATAQRALYVPLEALEGHGLSVAQWFTGSEPGARAALLADWRSRLTAELRRGRN